MTETERPVWCEALVPNATVFTSSVCVLIVELVAGRLISRYLGQSLYTWTSVIGVVLAGISMGNYLGGRLADRSASRKTLAGVLFVAAACCFSLLLTNDWVGQWQLLWRRPWPLRIFIHVALVFLAPSTALGMVSPLVTKRALAVGLATGRTVGDVYAAGAAGAIAGTFLAGFWLLAVLGAQAIVSVVVGVLALMGASYALNARWPEPRAQQQPHRQALGDATLPWRVRDWFVPNSTVFVTNVGIMALQLVAARLIARHFGQSLYTWTTVIGVVIAGISVGNFLGGRIADRFSTEKTITALFVLASGACLFIPRGNEMLTHWQALLWLPLTLRITIHVTALFLIPSALLGAVGPAAAKLALMQGHAAGRTVGNVYAWGSVGSIAGTFLTGYYLIAAWGSVGVVCGIVALSALMAVLYGRRWVWAYAGAMICLVPLLAAIGPWPSAQAVGRVLALRQTELPDVIYARESQYSYIRVRASEENPNERILTLDKLIHSRTDLAHPLDLKYSYEWIYATVLDRFYTAGTGLSALVIGGGGYSFPRYLELTRPGGLIVVSEIDPEVTEAAHVTFGLPRDTGMRIHNMDARNLIADLVAQKRAGEPVPKFDCIFGDSINDYSVPFHLTTHEFNASLDELLTDDGLYMLNMIDVLDMGVFLAAVVNTCRQTFPYVYVFNTDERSHGHRDTFVVVNAKRPLDLVGVPERIRQQYNFLGRQLTEAELDALGHRTHALVLTDDFAPVDNLLAAVVVLSAKDEVVDVLVSQADRLLGEGKHLEAMAKCVEANRWVPNRPEVHAVLGYARLRTGDFEGAVAALIRAIELDPTQPAPYTNLAEALQAQGRHEEAVAAWRGAIAVDPADACTYVNMSTSLDELGRIDEAVAAVHKALLIDPDYPAAHSNLAAFLFKQGDLEGARFHLEKVTCLVPEDTKARKDLAVVCWRLKDYERAWDYVRELRARGARLDPGFIEALRRDLGRGE